VIYHATHDERVQYLFLQLKRIVEADTRSGFDPQDIKAGVDLFISWLWEGGNE